jgi:microcystin degradation protein MlrC
LLRGPGGRCGGVRLRAGHDADAQQPAADRQPHRVADALADALWASRDRLPDTLPTVSEAIAAARAARVRRRLGTVCLSDASDMVGCGSVGENTAVVEALLREAPDLRSFAPVRDAVAVAATYDLPDGAPVSLDVGGRLAPEWYRPLHVEGRKVRSVATAFWGRAVVLDLGPVTLVVTEHAPMTVSPAFYREVGLSPLDADLCVVKSLFMFRLYFLPYNRLTLFARTRGMTDFDVYERLVYDRPVHPKDAVDDWRPGDRLRRGLVAPPTPST